MKQAREAAEKNIKEGIKIPKPEDMMPEKISEEEPTNTEDPPPDIEETEIETEE